MKLGYYVGGLIVVFVVSGTVLYRVQRTNSELTAQVTRLSRQNADLRYELKETRQRASEIGQQAVELDARLGATKIRATALETQNVRLARELTEGEQREVTLMAELAVLRQQNPVAGAEASRTRIAGLEAQLIEMLSRALADPGPTPEPMPHTASAPHQVVRVGPGEAFVVLDYGAEHGAQRHALIRLRRGTSELAQVQISDVRPRFSLAQIVPGTLKGQLQTGDLVVFNP